MKYRKFSKQKKYLIAGILGTLMILMGSYLLINAIKQDDNLDMLLHGVSLFIWLIFTINFWLIYRKELKSNTN